MIEAGNPFSTPKDAEFFRRAKMCISDSFKGALAVRARGITEEMKVAAAQAIASMVPNERLSADFILPDTLDKRVADCVAQKVADEAVRTGIARYIPQIGK